MKKKPITFAPIPADTDVVVGPQAFRLAAEVGIHPLDAGMRFTWAHKATNTTVYFDKARDTEWHHADEWAEVEAHFMAHLTEDCPALTELFA